MLQDNLKNRTIFCKDNLAVLEGINTASIDLIYLDPPFNKNKHFTAPSGKDAHGASFKDFFREEDVNDQWIASIKANNRPLHGFLIGVGRLGNKSNKYYLRYMAIRLIECQRILKDTGNIYLHCDPTMSHYLKIVLDCILGEDNFRNEIIWYYNSGARGNNFGKRHDIIFWYSKSDRYTFNKDAVRVPYSPNINIPKSKERYYHPLGKVCDDVWKINIISQNDKKERTGYPTQKPLALLEIIVKAGSNKGDVVLDPFCGCATTCVASENAGRQWLGIDISQKIYELVKDRLKKEFGKGLASPASEVVLRHEKTDILKRTDR